MNLSVLRNLSREDAARASDNLRRLAVAGVAACWLFSSAYFLHPNVSGEKPSTSVLLLGALCVVALLLDLIQNYVAAFAGFTAYTSADASIPPETADADAIPVGGISDWSFYTQAVLMGLKFVCVLVGFVIFAAYLLSLT